MPYRRLQRDLDRALSGSMPVRRRFVVLATSIAMAILIGFIVVLFDVGSASNHEQLERLRQEVLTNRAQHQVEVAAICDVERRLELLEAQHGIPTLRLPAVCRP